MKQMITNIIILLSLSTASLSYAKTIDVLVLYTPGATQKYGGDPTTRINHLLNVSNQIFSDSQLDVSLRLVHSTEIPYSDTNNAETALRDMTFNDHQAFENVPALREQYGADMVILLRPYSNSHESCGIAWIGGNRSDGDFSAPYQKDYAFSHVAMDTCGDYVTAHELGHNMGLTHSRLQNGVGGTFDYALGHGEHGQFVTVMAYQSAFGVDYTEGKVYKFSSPDLDCKGLACGIDRHDINNGADAVHALSISAPQVADYFETKVDDNDNKEELEKLKQLWEQAKKDFAEARANKQQAREDLIANRLARRDVQRAYNKSYRAYKKTIRQLKNRYYRVVKAVNNYNRLYRSSSPAKRQQLFNQYVKTYNAYKNAIQNYYDSIDEVRKWIEPLKQYNAAVIEKKAVYDKACLLLAESREAVIAAKKAYMLAINADNSQPVA